MNRRFQGGQGFTLARFLLVLELALIFFFCARPANDYDYGWHVVNGWHVSDGLTLSGRDIYSWTATNLWVAHEWATEAAMGFLHRVLGPSGNSIAAAAIGCLAYGIVAANLRARQVSMSAIVMTLPIVFVGAMRSVGVRPLMLELLFLSVLIASIDTYLSGRLGRRAALGLLLGGAIVWVNTHGSFPLLPVVLGITAAELLVVRDNRWRIFLAAAVVAGIASVANPWGIRIFEFATQSISSAPTLAYIDEWKKPRLNEWLALPILIQVALAGVGIGMMWRNRALAAEKGRVPLVVGSLRVVAFGYLAFASGRHVMLFGIAAAAMIAAGVQPLSGWMSRVLGLSRVNSPDSSRHIVNVVVAASLLAMIARGSWLQVSPAAQQRAIERRYPTGLLPALRTELGAGDRLFNEYSWGGFLILHDVLPVFIDGRSELYGNDQLRRYASIIHLDKGWERKFDSLGITKVLMPRSAPLTSALIRRDWSPIAGDSIGVLLGKR